MDTMYFLQLIASTATQDRTHTEHSLLAKYNCKRLVHWQQLHTIIIGMWAGANEDQYILPGKYIIYIGMGTQNAHFSSYNYTCTVYNVQMHWMHIHCSRKFDYIY